MLIGDDKVRLRAKSKGLWVFIILLRPSEALKPFRKEATSLPEPVFFFTFLSVSLGVMFKIFRSLQSGCTVPGSRTVPAVPGLNPALCGGLGVVGRLPRWFSGKESVCQCRRYRRCKFRPWSRKIPWRRKWQLTPLFLPGNVHGQRSLAGYSP